MTITTTKNPLTSNDNFDVGTGTLCRAYNDLKIAGRTNWTSLRDGRNKDGFYSIRNIYEKLGDMSAKYNWPGESESGWFGYSNESYYMSTGALRHKQYSLEDGDKKATSALNASGYYTCYSPN